MYTFCKQERLCSQRLIDELFNSGHRIMVYPFSVHWMACPNEAIPFQAQVLIATSKRKFRHAVDRNHVKRLIRECYRMHKPELYTMLESRGVKMVLAVNYIHNSIFDYASLMHKFDKVMLRLQQELDQSITAE